MWTWCSTAFARPPPAAVRTLDLCSRQLLFEADDLPIDLRIETTPDGAIWVGSSSDENRGLTLMVSKATSGKGSEVAASFTEKR